MEQIIHVLKNGGVVVIRPEKSRTGILTPTANLMRDGRLVKTISPEEIRTIKAKLAIREDKMAGITVLRVR